MGGTSTQRVEQRAVPVPPGASPASQVRPAGERPQGRPSPRKQAVELESPPQARGLQA